MEGKNIRILRAPVNKVIWNQEGRITEVANVDGFGNINWANGVEKAIQEYTEILLKGKF